MTLALACVPLALLLSAPLLLLERRGAASAGRRRAEGARRRAFQILPAFAVGVVFAQLAGAAPRTLDYTAVGFVCFHGLHAGFALAGRARLRDAAWQGSLLSLVAIFLFAIRALGLG